MVQHMAQQHELPYGQNCDVLPNLETVTESEFNSTVLPNLETGTESEYNSIAIPTSLADEEGQLQMGIALSLSRMHT